MNPRTLSRTAGISYIIIFFAAIFANFMALESLKTAPIDTVTNNALLVRLGVVAFLVTAVFDVVVAWALKELYTSHSLTTLSTYFRVIHAVIMGLGVFALLEALNCTTPSEVLAQVEIFNNIWLIGLFFFGVHLLLLAQIAPIPKFIKLFLLIAGVMYIIDTVAHFTLANYSDYQDIFLALVAIPSILGEMAFAIWLLVKGGKTEG